MMGLHESGPAFPEGHQGKARLANRKAEPQDAWLMLGYFPEVCSDAVGQRKALHCPLVGGMQCSAGYGQWDCSPVSVMEEGEGCGLTFHCV